MSAAPSLVVVVGNPKPRSRTLDAAKHVARAVALETGVDGDAMIEIDLATVASQLFDWSSGTVRAMVDQLAAAKLAVIASPTYKASYTGLLKAFLDWIAQDQLCGVLAIPLMVGAAPQHALAVEVHLRPVLVELGASMPTRGLYLLESQLENLDNLVGTWLDAQRHRLRLA